jgi:hypothetical protein
MERLTALQTRPRRATEDIGGITRPRRAEEDIGGVTRPRIATDLERAAREQYQMHLEKMRQLAHDLTSILDRAIYDGFEGGMKRGFQSLALGVLDLLKNVFMKRLEEILANAFSGIGQSRKGGGLAGFGGSFLLNNLPGLLTGFVGLGGVGSVGGLGTGISGAIGRASGGPIWPNQLYKVHRDEYIMPTAPGFVLPKGAGGQQTVINKYYTIQLPPDSRGSYNSPKSRRQVSETLIAALEASRS